MTGETPPGDEDLRRAARQVRWQALWSQLRLGLAYYGAAVAGVPGPDLLRRADPQHWEHG